VPPDPEAFAAWQEGVTLLAQDPHTAYAQHGAPPALVRAVERLEFAVAKDPNFAQAWATLAEAYDYLFPYVGRNPAEDASRAETAARRAVELDDNLASAHHMLGLIQWMMRWDFASAEASYKRALALDPLNVYAVVEYADLLRECGRSKEAAVLISKSQALLPALPQFAVKEAEIHLDFGATAQAIEASTRALQLKRDNLRAHLALAAAEEMQGDLEAARSRYEHVLTVNPTDRRALPAYGYLLARMRRRDLAMQVAHRLEDINANVRNCAFQIAVVYVGLGEEERALDWLDRALRTHQTHVPFAAVEHRFRSLHGHPRFRALLKEAGVAQSSD
jgi:serine/threonine-protein kinase